MAFNREAVVRSAEKYVAKGKIDGAIREYRKVLQDNPNDINTLNRVGDLYAKVSRIDEAVKLFVQIAEQYAGDGFFVKAIAIYKKIIKLDPTRLEIYERLADLYARQGLKNEARGQFQVLADYYLKHNQAASAITIHLRMAELEPDNPSHHLKLAELYQGQQLWDKAIREYKIIAEMMLERGAVDEAAQVYQRAFEVRPDDLAFITDAVMGLKDAGHGAAAAKLLAAAVQKNPQAERIVRLAGLGGREDDPRQTVAASASAPAQALPPAPLFTEEDELVIEIDDDVPSTLVKPPDGIDDGPGFGFRGGAAVLEEASFELELEAEPASGVLELPTATPEAELGDLLAQEQEQEEEEVEIELDLDFDGFADIQEQAGEQVEAPAAAVAEPQPSDSLELELEGVPELPDLGEVAFELEDEAPTPPLDLDETVGVTSFGLPRVSPPVLEEEPGQAVFELELEAEDGVELEVDLEPPIEADREREPEGEELVALELGSADLEAPAATELAIEADTIEPQLEPGAELEAPELVPEPIESAAGGAEIEAVLEAPEPEPVPVEPSVIDLLAEAEVFAKYGLEEKALDRVRRIFEREPRHLPAHCLEVEVLLKQRDEARLGAAAERTATLAAELGDQELWPKLTQRLERAGYSFAAGRLAAPPAPKKADRISELLGDLGLSGASRTRRAAEPSVDSLLGGLGLKPAATRAPAAPPASVPAASVPPASVPGPEVSSSPQPSPAALPPEVPAPAVSVPAAVSPVPGMEPELAPPPSSEAISEMPREAPVSAASGGSGPVEAPTFLEPTLPLPRFDEESFDEELPDIVLPERKVPKPTGAAAEALAAIDAAATDARDDGLDWLDEPSPSGGVGEALFDDEDEFFDLAAELEQELDRDEVLLATGEATPDEPSLEEIVEGFKKGVAEHLSEEDYDTHYNLGIAYREMGLIDEAIGEFQLSAKSSDLFVESCAMLGLCFVEKGLPELAVKWYQRALAHPGNAEETTLGLLYDLGSIYVNSGEDELAYKTFVEIYGLNSNYRDVVALLEELKPA